MSKPILIIEDEYDVLELIQLSVSELGYPLQHASDGETGLEMALTNNYSLVLLDINLPKLNGIDICKKIRQTKPYMPVIMLTARNSEIDRVLGLEFGADDYVTKPFSVLELTARIKARLRNADFLEVGKNANSESSEEKMVFGILVIDLKYHKVILDGKKVDLTPKEFELLVFLASNPGIAFTRDQLIEHVWNYTARGDETSVNSTVNRLRRKIEQNPLLPKYIQTVRGVGYRFAELNEL